MGISGYKIRTHARTHARTHTHTHTHTFSLTHSLILSHTHKHRDKHTHTHTHHRQHHHHTTNINNNKKGQANVLRELGLQCICIYRHYKQTSCSGHRTCSVPITQSRTDSILTALDNDSFLFACLSNITDQWLWKHKTSREKQILKRRPISEYS